MLKTRVAIIGGGLSGLHAAALLQARGDTDYLLFEARERFGGRIMSVPEQGGDIGRYDLGASWFWPALQPDLPPMVDRLGLTAFQQHEVGDMLMERSPTSPPLRVDGYVSAPPAWRLEGGMAALTDAIRHRLRAGKIMPGCRITALRDAGEHIDLEGEDARGEALSCRASRVLLALPPRLAATTLDFVPPLPEDLATQWKNGATWMAPHAKYLAVFDRPFWRERGLSGEARSAVGPLVEIHDASTRSGNAALFGFLGMPARARGAMPEADLLSLCRAQMARLFGDEAGTPDREFLKDWAADRYTAVEADHHPDPHHPAGVSPTAALGPWRHRLIGIASEWSPTFPGYVAGAIDAAERGVALLATAV